MGWSVTICFIMFFGYTLCAQPESPSNSESVNTRSKSTKAVSLYTQGKYYDAIEIYSQLLEKNKTSKNYKQQAINVCGLAKCFQKLKVNDLSLHYFEESIRLSEKYKLDENLMNCYQGLSLLYFWQGKLKESQNFADKGNYLATTQFKSKAHRFQNLFGMIAFRENNRQEGIDFILNAFRISQDQKEEESENARYASNLGVAYAQARKLDSALYFTKYACHYFLDHDQEYTAGIAFNNLGFLYAAMDSIDKSEYWLNLGIYVHNKNANWFELSKAYNQLFKLKDGVGEKEEAKEYLILVSRAKDSLILTNKSLDQKRYDLTLEHRIELNNLQNKYRQNKLESEFKRKQSIFWISMLIVSLVFLFVLLLFVRKSYKKSSQLRLMEIENQRKENRHIKDILEVRTKELSTQALVVATINKSVRSIQKLIQQGKIKGEVRQDVQAVMIELENEIKLNKIAHHDLEEFQKYYNMVDKGFKNKLKQRFPKLTSQDLTVCILIRSGLTSREIADLMGIEQKSLRMSRYRMHKKMGLEKGEKVEDFIIAF